MIWNRRNRLILGVVVLSVGAGVGGLLGSPDDLWPLAGFGLAFLLFGLNLSTLPSPPLSTAQIRTLALLGLILLVIAGGIALVNGHLEDRFTKMAVLTMSGLGLGYLLGAALHYGRGHRTGGAP